MHRGKARPLYAGIYLELKDKIQQGKLKVNQRMTERQLSHRYQVSRVTIRKALSLLVREGYLHRLPRLGTFVTSTSSAPGIFPGRYSNHTIGILIPCITFSLYAGIVRGAEDFLLTRDYTIMVGSYDANPEREKSYLERFTCQGISGLVIAPSYNSRPDVYLELLVKRNIPFVLVDTPLPGIDADVVQTDGVKGGYLGTKQLIETGCQKIAFLCGHLGRCSNSSFRLQGYRQAIVEAGLDFNPELIFEGDFSREFGYQTVKKLLSRESIDGIFSANEPITLGVLQAVSELPDDRRKEILVVSFDEISTPVEYSSPLMVVRQPRMMIGQVAAQILLERIKEKKRQENSAYRQIFLSPELNGSRFLEKTVFSEVNG
ncbi:MAG TPA: GntR family transcriptional regulator [bacterium]|nr:GntR family transcriptional regulator [bacterium]